MVRLPHLINWLIYTTNLFCRVNVSEDGKKALLTLSGGDMRRILNILQSTSMAFNEVSVAFCSFCLTATEDSHSVYISV